MQTRTELTMKAFLRQIAEHYSGQEGLCFIFPNRRSLVFFRKHFCSIMAEGGAARPVFEPEMLTINDFFYRIAGVQPSDKVDLLLELYNCYKELNSRAESLDEFIFWGDIILGDFNDVDKYLADPEKLFRNIADFKEMDYTLEYLNDRQKEAISNFLSHFREDRMKVTAKLDVKRNFLLIWNLLYPLYKLYNGTLAEKKMAYEGMVYRNFAERLKKESVRDVLGGVFGEDAGALPVNKYIFVGLNALNECEKSILRKMRDAGLAEFCWDYSGDMIQDKDGRASVFMAENCKEFRQAFELDPEGLPETEFNLISVPSSTGQAKQVPKILSLIADRNYSDCAIVLPDESLLMSVLNSIPEEVDSINVTMGYPLVSSEFHMLMQSIAALQMHIRNKKGMYLFYHKDVWNIFRSSIFKSFLDEGASDLVEKIMVERQYYISEEDLKGNEIFRKIFRIVVRDKASKDEKQTEDLADYFLDVISFIGQGLASNPEYALQTEFAKKWWQCVQKLKAQKLSVLPQTWLHLLKQLLNLCTVPFEGEPVHGLQIMGPLEMRVLDFKNLIILSCNENIFPRRSVSSSFIPPELRKGFGLPTYEYQDSVWAYYFYRMISRAEKVWMVRDSRTEGLKQGEESRYVKQLKYIYKVPVNEYVTKADITKAETDSEIEKTQEHVDIIRSKSLSATALQNYLTCPAKFFYSTVEGLKADNEVAENLDAGMIGNVYHKTMCAIFHSKGMLESDEDTEEYMKKAGKPQEYVSREYLQGILADKALIRRKILSLIKLELKTIEVGGRDLVSAEVIEKYVSRTIEADLEILKENKSGGFKLFGLEEPFKGKIHGFNFIGFVDRLDSIDGVSPRVVDYKSGSDNPDQLAINDDNAEKAVENIFNEKAGTRRKNKAALQFYIYDTLLRMRDGFKTVQAGNSMYAITSIFRAKPETYPVNKSFCDFMDEKMKVLLDEIADTAQPFRRTEDSETCKYCDFKIICGR